MNREELQGKHLSELHALAAEAGVPRYRLLQRDELVGEIVDRKGKGGLFSFLRRGGKDEPKKQKEKSGREKGGRGEKGEERASGTLDVMPQRYGFLRVGGSGHDSDDVYVSAAQIRRCKLRSGDKVEGPARAPRKGEKHRALVQVELVNGSEPRG